MEDSAFEMHPQLVHRHVASSFVLPDRAAAERSSTSPLNTHPDRSDAMLVRSILNQLHFGVALIGERTQLLFVNEAAVRECNRNPTLRIVQNMLMVVDDQSRKEFLRALERAREGIWSFVRLRKGDERLILGFRPLHAATSLENPPVLVTFGIHTQSDLLSIHLFAKACGVSPAEAEVLKGLAFGLSPKEIAFQNNVALSTVRTQVKCLRIKTGAKSITELIRMLGMPTTDNAYRRAVSRAKCNS